MTVFRVVFFFWPVISIYGPSIGTHLSTQMDSSWCLLPPFVLPRPRAFSVHALSWETHKNALNQGPVLLLVSYLGGSAGDQLQLLILGPDLLSQIPPETWTPQNLIGRMTGNGPPSVVSSG